MMRGTPGGEGTRRARVRALPKSAVDATIEPRKAKARALVVSPTDRTAMLVGPVLGALEIPMENERGVDEARRRISRSDRPKLDLLLIDETLPEAHELARYLSIEHPAIAIVMVADNPELSSAIDAMRSGAADLIDLAGGSDGAQAPILSALNRARIARQREERTQRLRKVCKKLNSARHEVTSQVSDMCNDLVDAYRELSGEIDKLSISGEFNGIIRQELEIESLLRVVLEFILAKSGPTNAAIFLPASGHEYSLGAYVNADLPKSSVDPLLDHLADVLAPRFENRPGVHRYETRRDVHRLLGEDAHWLPDQTMLAFPCHHDEECLAIVTLFRDDHEPFSPEVVQILETISGLFSRQLARIIHVHHRHLPKDQWGALGEDDSYDFDEGPDDLDLAA